MNNRPSAYPTIEAATDAASIKARAARTKYEVIADQPHDGGFTIVQGGGCDAEYVYINVDEDGKASEGKAAMSLPIGFEGALPIPQK